MRNFIVALLVVLMAGHSAFGQLPAPEAEQAIKDAVRDAEQADVLMSSVLAGFCCSVPGVVITSGIQPTVPPTKLLGKSSTYVSHYTETYQELVKNRRAQYAFVGCLVSGAIYGSFYVWVYRPLSEFSIPSFL